MKKTTAVASAAMISVALFSGGAASRGTPQLIGDQPSAIDQRHRRGNKIIEIGLALFRRTYRLLSRSSSAERLIAAEIRRAAAHCRMRRRHTASIVLRFWIAWPEAAD
jgi:hypothetical protein